MPPATGSGAPTPILMFGIRGRDGSTPAFRVPNDRCVEALNVDWFESSLGRKRGGATSVSLSGGTAQSGVISSLFSHVPAADQSAREFWAIDDAATPRWKRLTGGTSWADVTVADAVSTKPWEMDAISFNGKMVVAYDSTVNRLHCWDPATSTVRRMGLDKANAPTGANTGAGTYAAVERWYKVRWVKQSSSVNIIEGELSSTLYDTPSGGGTAYRVTQPTPPSEGETHWQLYGSADGANFFLLSTIAVATPTYDDSTAPSAYGGEVAPDIGSRTLAPSARYLSADSARIIMAGAWETSAGNSMAPKNNRIWWTAPLGATDNGDDERVSNTSDIKNYGDVDEAIVGLSKPLNGNIYVFSYDGQWKMVPTGLYAAPYLIIRVAGGLGCIHHKTIVMSEDEDGEPCIYFLSKTGPVRIGKNGQQSLHEDIDDIWRTVNLSATTIVAHGVPYATKHQIWWYVATGSSNEPDTKIVFDTNLGRVIDTETNIHGGWSKHTGASCAARCSVAMSNTLGTTMSRDLKPHIGRSTGTAIWKTDTDDLDDAGTTFQGYVTSRIFTPWGIGNKGTLPEEAMLSAVAATGVTVTLTVIRDFGRESLTSSVLLTATGSETRVMKRFEAARGAELKGVQFTAGDASAVANSWNLDLVVAPWSSAGRA